MKIYCGICIIFRIKRYDQKQEERTGHSLLYGS